MVIRHYNRHSKGIGKRSLLVCRNPIVTGKYRIRTRIICLLNQIFVQSITIAYPVRNGCIYSCAALRQAAE